MPLRFRPLAFYLLAVCALPAFGKGTLCERNEINYSTCLSGSRLISLCASRDLDGQNGYMQFRYGKPGKIEISYPDKTQNPRYVFFESHRSYTDGSESRISFTREGAKYVLFTNTVWATGKITHGLVISRPGQLPKKYPCIHPTATVHTFPGSIFGQEAFADE